MSLLSRSRKLLEFTINTFANIGAKSKEIELIPGYIFFAQNTRHYGDKFSTAPKKRKSRKNATNARKVSLRQSQVFQLDPLREEENPDGPTFTRQRIISLAILEAVTSIFNGPELDCSVKNCQLEITQVRTTPNLQLATIYWTVSGEVKHDRKSIQNMLEENTDHIRRLLPSYSALARFPKLAFIKDNSAEYEAEMEFLMQKAKHNDSSSQNGTESEDN